MSAREGPGSLQMVALSVNISRIALLAVLAFVVAVLAAPATTLAASTEPHVTIVTDQGTIEIALDAKARAWLADAGYDPVYGARPLKRVIQRRLQDPLAQLILEGKISDGSKVKVTTGKNGMTINGVEFAAHDDELDAEQAPQATRVVH